MSGWTDERVQMLKAWVAEGLTYRMITAQFVERGFAVTRNGVLGKAHRLGLASAVSRGSRSAPSESVARPPRVAKVAAKPAAPPRLSRFRGGISPERASPQIPLKG